MEVINVRHLTFTKSGENLPIIMMTAISAWWTFPNIKGQRTGKDCLSKYSFVYCICQPWPRTAYSSTFNAMHAILSTSSEDDGADFEVDTQCSSKDDPHFLNQNELDDLTRDLGLTKAKAEILSSRPKEWNLLAPSCKISKPRK